MERHLTIPFLPGEDREVAIRRALTLVAEIQAGTGVSHGIVVSAHPVGLFCFDEMVVAHLEIRPAGPDPDGRRRQTLEWRHILQCETEPYAAWVPPTESVLPPTETEMPVLLIAGWLN